MSTEPQPADSPSVARPFFRRPWVVFAAALLLVGGCVGGYFLIRFLTQTKPEVPKVDPNKAHERKARDVPAVTFTDVTAGSGLNFTHFNGFSGEKLLPETMGGGVAVFDYDGDGKPDILFVNGCPWPGLEQKGEKPTLKLYRNLGTIKFEDVTEAVGLNVSVYGMGVAVGDIDNDGRPDLFVSCVGQHKLFRNVDGKRFEDISTSSGVEGKTGLPDVSTAEFMKWEKPIPFGSSATFLDYDGDGKLDLFVCHYVTWSPAADRAIVSIIVGRKRTFVQPKDMVASQCALYRNLGGGKFEDVSAPAGVIVVDRETLTPDARLRPVGKALGVVAFDADGDGWPDMLVANDSVQNFFFHNQAGEGGKRVFVEKGLPLGAAYAENGVPRGGMGIDWGEFAPGRCSAVIANFANEPLTFLEKDATKLLFSDSAQGAGLIGPSRTVLKFGTLLFDYDNDGRLDLMVNNGHIEPDIAAIQSYQRYKQPPQLYWNTGDPQCVYEAVPEAKGGADLFKPLVGRGSAFADLDGDGDLDVVLAANGGPPHILRNDAPNTNKSVRLVLEGDGVKSNRSAIGAVVTVQAGGQTITRNITGGRGYLSQSELALTVGIGTATKADKVTVRWPGQDAGTETWTNLDAGKPHVLKQGTTK